MASNSGLLEQEISLLPSSLQESASVFFQRFELPEELVSGEFRALVRLAAYSEYAARILLRERDWFLQALGGSALSRAGLAEQIGLLRLDAGESVESAQETLRVIRNRQLLAILWREAIGENEVADTLEELSMLADALIRSSAEYALQLNRQRFGDIRCSDDEQSSFVVLAMGKLGGRELNFSSDVDLIFLYSADGASDGARQLSAQEYYGRTARTVVALLEPVTAAGFAYRVDTRLRPFGASGPPVVSFVALESYLLQHGRSWERYAFVKARAVFGESGPVSELMENLIAPFVYRQYLDYGVFESLREMKGLIEEEVSRRELADNVKLGPGGIREIEFIVQSLQLVRGGADAALRGSELQPVLTGLAGHGGLDRETVERLLEAYYFLRRLENCLQAIRDQQTHDLPTDERERARVSLAMGYEDWQELAVHLAECRSLVSKSFASVVFRTESDEVPDAEADEQRDRIAALWESAADADGWATVLRQLELPESGRLGELLAHFSRLPTSRQIGRVSRRRLIRFLPMLLREVAGSQNPGVTLQRILGIVSNIMRRSAYVALLNENPLVLKRLVDLCSTSVYLADEISRFPLLLDEMLDPRLFSVTPAKVDLERELQVRLAQIDEADSEAAIDSLAHFQRAALFRIAVADFSGSLPLMQVSDRLTDLAEVILNAALAIAWRDLATRHGEPCYRDGDALRPAGFGVVAYGKLAGMEMSYSSDLDLVFLHDSRGSKQHTNGDKQLDNSMFFSRLVRRLVHFLTTQTSSGVLYAVDTRLRPSGRSGLLVTSIEAFERYQEENAWTWEHQALLRSRPVAGSPVVAREFERVRADTLRQRVNRDELLADVRAMRGRMRKHLDESDQEHFDIKQGSGGMGDIEFLVQYLVLSNAREHPAIIHYPDNIRQIGTLEAAGFLNEDEARDLQSTYQQYRQRLHRLALDDKGSVVPATEFTTERACVQRIAERFMLR